MSDDRKPEDKSAASDPASPAPAETSERERATRRKLIFLISLLIVAIGSIAIIRFDEIKSLFEGTPDVSEKDVLSGLRTEDGDVTPPVDILIEDGEHTTHLKALDRRWAIYNRNFARVQGGRVLGLLTALDEAAKEFDASVDRKDAKGMELANATTITFTFENEEVHTISVAGEKVLYSGAERPSIVAGLHLSADPETWIPRKYNLLNDFDYGNARGHRLDKDTFGALSVVRGEDAWSAQRVVATGKWLVNSKHEGRVNILNGIAYAMQNINILGLWEGPAPELYTVTALDDLVAASMRVSLPKDGGDAALEIDKGSSLYRISAATAGMLVPSLDEIIYKMHQPPPEGVEGPEMVGQPGKGYQIIVFNHSKIEGILPGSIQRTPQEARKLAEEKLAELQAIEDQEKRGIAFGLILRQETSWRDENGAPLSDFDRYPAHVEEFQHVIAGIQGLERGAVADKVFSTAFGEVIVWHTVR